MQRLRLRTRHESFLERTILSAGEMVMEIQGFMPDDELAVLKRFATGKRVLEVGCWKGRSTIGMAEVAKLVWTVDHFKGDQYAGKAFTLPEFIENLGQHGLRDKIVCLVGDFYKVIPKLDLSQFDVIFYDACHDYDPTKDFLEMLDSQVRPGTPVLVHDYAEGYPQVMRAVQEYATERSYKVTREHTLGIIQT